MLLEPIAATWRRAMSYLVLQRHANEQILLTANPDVSDEELIRHIREQGIAVCVSRFGLKTASIAFSAPESMKMSGVSLPRTRGPTCCATPSRATT